MPLQIHKPHEISVYKCRSLAPGAAHQPAGYRWCSGTQTIEPDDLNSQDTFIIDSFEQKDLNALKAGAQLQGEAKGEALGEATSVNYIDEKCTDKHLLVRMQVDAEWFHEGSPCKPSKNLFITLQVALMGRLRHRKFIFEHPDWKKLFPETPHASVLHERSSSPHQPILPPWCGADRCEAQGSSAELKASSSALAASMDLLLPNGAPYKVTQVKLDGWPDPPWLRPCEPQGGACLHMRRVGSARGGFVDPVGPIDFTDDDGLNDLRLQLHVFWSFGDITAFFGRQLSKHIADRLVTRKTLRCKDRWMRLPLVVKDRFGVCRRVKLQIVDWFGIEYQSLKQTSLAYNVRMTSKDLMDGFKTRMHEAYRNPETRADFVEYALSDLCLGDLEDAYKDNFQELCELAGVKAREACVGATHTGKQGAKHLDKPAMTKGAKVAMMFRRFLDTLCVVRDDFNEIADLRGRSKPPDTSRHTLRPSITDLMKVYGCQQLLESDPALTKRHLAIVQGGRIKHELPAQSVFSEEPILSMDLQSCYGMALINLFVPIGHPSLIYFPMNRPEEWMTLGKFLKKFGHELVDLCWYAVIDTCDSQLSFCQNLIYSKYLNKADKPERELEAHDNESFKEDDSHIKGQFMLLEKEIKNGILTSTILAILKNVCSSQEWGELMRKIRIKAAMIYPRSQMMEYEGPQTFVEWQEALRKQPRRLTTIFDISGHTVQDRRPGPWVKFPLKTFISPLVEARMKLKAEMKTLKADLAEYSKKNAMQVSLKGVVNTVYGVLASPYFAISCPCAANNITAMARGACWMMATASGGIKSITDGADCKLNYFRFCTLRNPSMNTIALMGQPHLLPRTTRHYFKEAPLGSKGDKNIIWEWKIKEPVKAGAQHRTRARDQSGRSHEQTSRMQNTTCTGMGSLRDSIQKGPHTRTKISDEGASAEASSASSAEPVKAGAQHPALSQGEAIGEAKEVYFTFNSIEYPFKEAVKLIEQLYKEHLFDFFSFSRHLEELEWARRFNIECKVLGYGYASHGLADYLIGTFQNGGFELIKARGHKLQETHYDPNTEQPMQSPMKTILEGLFEGRPLKAGIQATYTKPCSVGEYLKRRTLRDHGILPGDNITRSVRPKLIPVSEFSFQTLKSRLSWEKYYNYVNRVYGCGLEAPYLDANGFLHDIDKAKFDIQQRILTGNDPKRR